MVVSVRDGPGPGPGPLFIFRDRRARPSPAAAARSERGAGPHLAAAGLEYPRCRRGLSNPSPPPCPGVVLRAGGASAAGLPTGAPAVPRAAALSAGHWLLGCAESGGPGSILRPPARPWCTETTGPSRSGPGPARRALCCAWSAVAVGEADAEQCLVPTAWSKSGFFNATTV